MSSFTLIGHALQSVIKLKPLLHMALCIVLLYSVQHWYANLGQNTLIHKMINGFLNSPHPNFIPRSEQSQQQSSASFDIFFCPLLFQELFDKTEESLPWHLLQLTGAYYLLLTTMFRDRYHQDIDFVIMMMVQCQCCPQLSLLSSSWSIAAEANETQVCMFALPFPLLGQQKEASPESPDDLELYNIPDDCHSFVCCWNDPKNVGIAKISQNLGEKSRSVTHEWSKEAQGEPRQGQGGTKRSEGGSEVKESEMAEDTLRGGDITGSGHPCCLRPLGLLTHDSVTKCTLVTLAHGTSDQRIMMKSWTA